MFEVCLSIGRTFLFSSTKFLCYLYYLFIKVMHLNWNLFTFLQINRNQKQYSTPQEAERSCVRHLPPSAISHSFTWCMWIGGFTYAPRDQFLADQNQVSLGLRVKGSWAGWAGDTLGYKIKKKMKLEIVHAQSILASMIIKRN